MLNIYNYLKSTLPNDHTRQTRAVEIIETYYEDHPKPAKVLDFGCGVGASIDFFKKALPETVWVGVDIEESPEVAARNRTDGEFHTYDGINLPFEDNSFDLVYSNQVLEHVRYPEKVLAEIARVMKKDGVFIGQTSQLEPYHSYSIFNFTVYGFKCICEDNGLQVDLFRPSIDGVTLIERSVKERPAYYSQWFKEESPINYEIERIARKEKQSNTVINFRKLLHCGQFCFVCTLADG